MCVHACVCTKGGFYLQDLPAAVGETESGTIPGSNTPVLQQPEEDQMRIAWRYQNLPKVQVA